MPQLKETIDGIAAVRPKQMIRIGCEHGSGFIYVGEADMVDYGKLNDICIKKLPKNTPHQYKTETRKKWKDAVTAYEPLQYRTVIDRFRSQVEDHTIVIVEGFGGFIQYDPADSGRTDYDQQAMIDLVGAIYKKHAGN